ncbi:hypothetical protein LOAG_07364 [Loa loa]|uniref:Uncharacterized protein n=1 Tax=Loa loa TaxID=7209 RepID=A0A1S0TVR0_LOALO|nr:hypothetical protein LOAG_07364 [Loa loa]EFO21124.1 hypothetical protein LOAG_07364 [Loa loa]
MGILQEYSKLEGLRRQRIRDAGFKNEKINTAMESRGVTEEIANGYNEKKKGGMKDAGKAFVAYLLREAMGAVFPPDVILAIHHFMLLTPRNSPSSTCRYTTLMSVPLCIPALP